MLCHRTYLISLLLALCGLSNAYVHASVHQKALRSRQIGTEGQILARMFSEYDPQTRPPVRDAADHSAIVVITSVYINRISWDDASATVDLYLRQQYEDSRLVYEVDPRENIHEITIPAGKKVWKPNTFFTSADEITKFGQNRERVVVEPSGFVRLSEQRRINVDVVNGGSFPFIDTRSFRLRLSSYSHDLADVVYLWANSPPTVVPVEVSKELMDGPYAFIEAFAGDCVGNYSVGVHSCIDVTVTFEGPGGDAFLRVFLPALLLVVASWLQFFVHGSWSVPRTVSAALPFLVFACIHIFHPSAVQRSPASRFFLIGCLVFTFLSFLEYFIVIACGVHRKVTRYQSLGVRDGSTEPLSTVVSNQPIENEVVEKPGRCAQFAGNNGLDIVSRFFFPIAFLIFLIFFIVLFLI